MPKEMPLSYYNLGYTLTDGDSMDTNGVEIAKEISSNICASGQKKRT